MFARGRSDPPVRSTDLDDWFPLDAGGNAAVTLANGVGIDQLPRDEITRLAPVHAALAETRLLTTPTLSLARVRAGRPSVADAEAVLAERGQARTRDANAPVRWARAVLERGRA